MRVEARPGIDLAHVPSQPTDKSLCHRHSADPDAPLVGDRASGHGREEGGALGKFAGADRDDGPLVDVRADAVEEPPVLRGDTHAQELDHAGEDDRDSITGTRRLCDDLELS